MKPSASAIVLALRATRARISQGWGPISLAKSPLTMSGNVWATWCGYCGRVHEVTIDECPPTDCEASIVCLLDAMCEACGLHHPENLDLFFEIERLLETLRGGPLLVWESEVGRRHSEIVKLLDMAILRAEAVWRTEVQTFVHGGN